MFKAILVSILARVSKRKLWNKQRVNLKYKEKVVS